MSIISQIGVVILIAFIVLVLIRSNKNLKNSRKNGLSITIRRNSQKKIVRDMMERVFV